ncbi:M50 family metallopeptidase [Streptomyces sp. SHP 1-2]|uniref:M50 family metallopeptidase n=1 Tax=Streptomyces sp. SHP 1-2 TaxID=2769489 RepID=UPI0022385290|nr:M50 family metallopeptidase [Streptomyces sp. SHP 1-2]
MSAADRSAGRPSAAAPAAGASTTGLSPTAPSSGGRSAPTAPAAPSAAERSAAVRAYRPALRPGVLMSPPLLRGPRTVHLIKHPVSGAAFEVGPKEHFVISRLDGTRNLDDLVSAYADRFRLRLPEEQWTRLLGLLGTRGLLAGSPDPAPPGPAPARTGGFWKGSRRTVADAHATTGRLYRPLRPLLRPWVQLPLLAAVLAMTAALLARPAALVDGTLELLGRPSALVPFAVFLWFSICLHELAHGVAARHYGGVVSEIGLRWRFPTLMMYCTVDNYLFLPGLRAKLVVAGAGAYVNLVLLLPLALWWSLLDPSDPVRPVLTGMLFVGTVQALSNLVPLPPLDGYRMLCHLLGAANLAPETRTYLALRRGGRDAVAAYPPRARRVYTGYALSWTALVLLAVAGSVTCAVLLLLR